ncbi:MAG: hypothetical protein GXP25_16315 [Planctomycetes bacterium]|nr:hypothetical protein [Planctomycetota bacterium]
MVQSVGEEGHHVQESAKQCPACCSPTKILGALEKRYQNERPGRGFYRFVLETLEKPMIEKALRKTGGNQLAAARMLGINRNTIRSKIRRLGIRLPGMEWNADEDDPHRDVP